MVITLSDLARATARRYGVPEPQVLAARRRPVSSHERPDCLVVSAELADGRRLRMRCSPSSPGYVMTLDVLARDAR